MKRLIYFLSFFIFIGLVSCGESDSERALRLQKEELASVQAELNRVNEEKRITDSIAENTMTILRQPIHSISDREIIKLFGITIRSLGSDFINPEIPSLKPKFSILARKFYTIGSDEFLFSVLGITNPNDFHMSMGTTSVALMKYSDGVWKLKSIKNNLGGGYGWGEPANVEGIYQFGRTNLAVSLEAGYAQGANEMTQRELIGVVDFSVTPIYQGEHTYSAADILESNEGFDGVEIEEYRETDFTFEKTENAFYNMKIISKASGKKTKSSVLNFDESKKKYR
jgi:hypothetical protein